MSAVDSTDVVDDDPGNPPPSPVASTSCDDSSAATRELNQASLRQDAGTVLGQEGKAALSCLSMAELADQAARLEFKSHQETEELEATEERDNCIMEQRQRILDEN